ncbi:hypothetical protein CP335_24765 [Pseudomonas fluorescens]|uniref:Uncharacterized protein n=1 Tax=Pseudomonas fluorescens TaxID=294 RepID=A0A854WZG5_PSEFL|nr:hypothetical protein CP335_24765 [Pseudomonas fluorescens]
MSGPNPACVSPYNFGTDTYPVGASLLAKASDQPTSSLNVTPLSRASPLPQGRVCAVGYHVAAVAFGKLSLPLSTNRMVPNTPPASLPRST